MRGSTKGQLQTVLPSEYNKPTQNNYFLQVEVAKELNKTNKISN